jgi:protein-L-isoaspartate O-methyltransferase
MNVHAANAYSKVKEAGLYDGIHVGAGVNSEEILFKLSDLLKPSGWMIVPLVYDNSIVPATIGQVVAKQVSREVSRCDIACATFIPSQKYMKRMSHTCTTMIFH